MPYDQCESRLVSARAYARLSARATARPRLAVVGEFSSGKSTLLNLLLGREVLPTRTTATAAPAVWISHGTRRGYYIDAAGDQQPLPEDGIEAVPPGSRYIRLWLEADFLETCDILDLSGLADPGRTDDMTYQMLGHAHAVIWCTPATQAWRQSERAAWLAVPPRLRRHSLLAVTRMDKLRNDTDRERVMRRVSHEAAGLFSQFEPISALMALKALAENDAAAWDNSGIDALLEGITEQLSQIEAGRSALLRRYQPHPEGPEDQASEGLTPSSLMSAAAEEYGAEEYGAEEYGADEVLAFAPEAADEGEGPESEEKALLESLSRPAPLMLVTPFRPQPRPLSVTPESALEDRGSQDTASQDTVAQDMGPQDIGLADAAYPETDLREASFNDFRPGDSGLTEPAAFSRRAGGPTGTDQEPDLPDQPDAGCPPKGHDATLAPEAGGEIPSLLAQSAEEPEHPGPGEEDAGFDLSGFAERLNASSAAPPVSMTPASIETVSIEPVSMAAASAPPVSAPPVSATPVSAPSLPAPAPAPPELTLAAPPVPEVIAPALATPEVTKPAVIAAPVLADEAEAPSIAPAPPPAPVAETSEAARLPDIEAALQRVLSGYFPSRPPAPPAVPAAARAPHQTEIWAEIVSRAGPGAADPQIVAMIAELLARIFPAPKPPA